MSNVTSTMSVNNCGPNNDQTPHSPKAELYEFKKPFLLQELTQTTLLRAALSQRQLFEVIVDVSGVYREFRATFL